MKNILFLHSSAELYGSDRSLLNLVRGLDKKKYQLFVILPCDGPLAEEIKKIKGVNVFLFPVAVLRRKNLSISGMYRYCKDYRESCKFLKKFIDEHKIDIVETNTSVVFPGAVMAKKMKKESIWHIREIISNKFENRIISFMMNRYADVIVANSKATAEALKVRQEKIRVVYNAVEFDNTNKPKKIGSRVIVGMAGRINRWKGQQLFVDAAKEVHKKYGKVAFLIAGDAYKGEDYIKEALEEKIKVEGLEGSVKLLGRVEKMSEFYDELDIFVLPSVRPEPFGLVIVEAMGRGIPVVATRHGGPMEIIRDGENGFLVDYNNAKEMAERIAKLIEDSETYQSISEKGMKEARKKYTIGAMVGNMEKIYDEV